MLASRNQFGLLELLSLGDLQRLHSEGKDQQQLNNWPVAGEKDYPANIARLACYITPRFQAELKRDLDQKGRRAELARTRALQEMFDRPYEPKRVWVVSSSLEN